MYLTIGIKFCNSNYCLNCNIHCKICFFSKLFNINNVILCASFLIRVIPLTYWFCVCYYLSMRSTRNAPVFVFPFWNYSHEKLNVLVQLLSFAIRSSSSKKIQQFPSILSSSKRVTKLCSPISSRTLFNSTSAILLMMSENSRGLFGNFAAMNRFVF